MFWCQQLTIAHLLIRKRRVVSHTFTHLERAYVEYTFPNRLCIINVLVTSQQRDTDKGRDRMIESTATANRAPRIVNRFISDLRRRAAPSSADKCLLFISTQTRNKMLTPTCCSHQRDEDASQALLYPTRGSRARAVTAIKRVKSRGAIGCGAAYAVLCSKMRI